jgi:hypothetical protein
MGAGIEAVAGEVGHVDAADERELVVDDDRLFLVIGWIMSATCPSRTHANRRHPSAAKRSPGPPGEAA